MFGSWGPIVFQMSSRCIYSFSNMQRTVGYRHPSMEIVGGKPASQYTGEELEEVTLELHFAAELGHNPRVEVDRLESLARKGYTAPLIFGGRPVGRNEFEITKLPQEWLRFDHWGKLKELKGTVTFQEFVPRGRLS